MIKTCTGQPLSASEHTIEISFESYDSSIWTNRPLLLWQGVANAEAISVCWFSEMASVKFMTEICCDGNLRGKEDHRDPILQEIPATSLIQSKFLPECGDSGPCRL